MPHFAFLLHGFRHRLGMTIVHAGLAAAFALALSVTAAGGAEIETSADPFCQAQFGADAFASVDRRDGGLLCSLRTDGGLGLTHIKVNAGDVCFAAHRTRSARMVGETLVCSTDTGSGGSGPAIEAMDLAEYCPNIYGPTATFSTRLSDGAPLCSISGDGGLSLTHLVIDTAGICGGPSGRLEGTMLYCSGSGPETPNGGGGSGAGASGSGQPPQIDRDIPPYPPLTREDIIDAGGSGDLAGRVLSRAHLLGCGNGDPETFVLDGSVERQRLMVRNPEGLGGWGWLYFGVDLPCPALAGGRVVSFDEVCAPFDEGEGLVAKIRPDGTPICWPRDEGFARMSPIDLGGHFGLRGNMLFGICQGGLLGYFSRAPSEDDMAKLSKVMPIVKYRLGDLSAECFYMDRADWAAMFVGEDEFVEGEM